MLEDKFLTVKEVAVWLNVSTQTVRSLLHRNEIEHIKLGENGRSRYRIAISNVLEWSRKKTEKS